MFRKILLTGVSLALIGLSRFIFNSLTLRNFGSDTTGQLNVAMSLAMLASLPATTSVGTAVVRFVARARGRGQFDQENAYIKKSLFSTLSIALAVVLALAWVSDPLAAWNKIDANLIWQVGLFAGTYALYQWMRGVYYARNKVGPYTILEGASGVAFVICLLALTLSKQSFYLLLSFCVAYGFFFVTALIREPHLLFGNSATLSEEENRDFWNYSLLAFVATSASLAVRELAILAAPHFSDFSGAAHLALCQSMLVPLQFLPRTLRTVLFAESAELDGRGDLSGLRQSTNRATHWLFFLQLPVCVIVILFSERFLRWSGGQTTRDHLLIFAILTFAALLEIVATPITNTLPGIGRIGITASGAVFGLVVAVVAGSICAERWGMVGLTLGVFLSSAIKCGLPMFFGIRQYGFVLTSDRWRATLFAIVSCVAVLLFFVGTQASWIVSAYVIATALFLKPELTTLGQLIRKYLRPATIS